MHTHTHMHTYACTHLSKCKNTIPPYVYFKVFSSRSQADTGGVGGRWGRYENDVNTVFMYEFSEK